MNLQIFYIISVNFIMFILISILFYLYFQKKECFEGIAGTSFVSRVPKGTIVAWTIAIKSSPII